MFLIPLYYVVKLRRLLPASTALIRDFTVLDLNDEIEKPKVQLIVLVRFTSTYMNFEDFFGMYMIVLIVFKVSEKFHFGL